MTDIRIIVPFYNAAAFLPDCLESIAGQSLRCRAYLVDDSSTDGWRESVGALVNEFAPGAVGFRAMTTHERRGELASIMSGTAMADRDEPLTDETVIVHVCGDDALAGPDAIAKVAGIYQDPNVWMTYGSYEDFATGRRGHCRPLPVAARIHGDYRARPWVTSHLRAYRYGLWRRIPAEQLIDPETGQPWYFATDLACVFPMLEMARERAVYVDDILYRYRRHDSNVPPSDYGPFCDRVRTLPRLARLDAL
jgi:glycosyltransferase involved in cell wall biosynthesis